MSDPSMNPSNGNPMTGGAAQREAYSTPTGRPLRIYKGGPAIALAMSAPASVKECAVADLAPRVEFLVRVPASVTAYTIHYGRWLRGPAPQKTGSELDEPVEIGTLAVTGATAGKVARVVFETATDPVWCYVAGFTGTVDGGASFGIWYRGLPGTP